MTDSTNNRLRLSLGKGDQLFFAIEKFRLLAPSENVEKDLSHVDQNKFVPTRCSFFIDVDDDLVVIGCDWLDRFSSLMFVADCQSSF
jgi:hypothetical protein